MLDRGSELAVWLLNPGARTPSALVATRAIDTMNTSALIQKVRNFCHTLRDDGVGYGDYLEHLTYLLFLKMAHEYAEAPYERDTRIPKGYDWATLRTLAGEPLEAALAAVRDVTAALPRSA